MPTTISTDYVQQPSGASFWDDLRITPGEFDFPGAADPTSVAFAPGGTSLFLYEFQIDDYVNFVVQLPHNYKVGTDLKPHVHWTPGARGNEENGKNVQWRLAYAVAAINGTFGATVDVDMEDACDGTDYKHQMTPSGTISGTGLGISTMLVCKLSRIAATSDGWVGTASGERPLLLEFDIHYQIDGLGSLQETSKT